MSGQEVSVVVTYVCRDFVLNVFWDTTEDTSDAAIVSAAAAWFQSTYGLNPNDHALTVSIEVVPK